MTDLRNVGAKARDEWLESFEGKGCTDPQFLKDRTEASYLRNRLERAFQAGWDAAEKAAIKRRNDEWAMRNGEAM